MSFWTDVFGGAAQGAMQSAVGRLGTSAVNGRGTRPTLGSVCGQAHWVVDVDHGGGKYELHFTSTVYGVRRVLVNWGDNVASFALRSACEMPPGEMFAELGYALLMRNKELGLGAWDMRELGSGNFGFVVSYTALIAGLDGATLKAICQGLVDEAALVDGGLRSKGLI